MYFGVALGAGVYTLLVAYFSWKLGRASRWEEMKGLPPLGYGEEKTKVEDGSLVGKLNARDEVSLMEG
jgi:hypothetical protein